MIITTTDGSPRSLRALPHAAVLAKTLGMPLNVLQVFDPSSLTARHWPNENVLLREETTERQAAMRLLMTDPDIQPETACEPLIKRENVADAVLRIAANRHAQILAMDSRGHGMLRHAMLGSVAMEVLSRSPIPVMVSGPEALPPHTADPYVILVTTDGSEPSRVALDALSRMPGKENLQFVLATVYVPTFGDHGETTEVDELGEMPSQLRQTYFSDVECDLVVRKARDFSTPEMVLLELADERRASMLAMSTRGHGAARHVLFGSFAAAVLRGSKVPLLLSRA